QALLVEAEPDAPQARHRLEIAFARCVKDVRALAALDHQGTGLLMGARVGVGMELVGHIPGLLRIRQHGHLRKILKVATSPARPASSLGYCENAELATPIRRQQALSSVA